MPPELTDDIEVLRSWVGRSVSVADSVPVSSCRLLEATLDRAVTLGEGDALPPLWHYVIHLPSARLDELGEDGHPARGGLLPPVGLPRRMWAGGRFDFLAPIRVGEMVARRSTVTDVAMKAGRSGPLCFVTVTHEFVVGDDLRLREEQDLVYRDAPDPAMPVPPGRPAPGGAAWRREIVPSAVLLFRYSALTFNGHRIHYDRDYCRDVEGHPGLVVHGPLIATLLADLAVRGSRRRLARFSFRAVAPLFDTAPFTIAGRPDGADGAVLWAATADGALAMEARATLAGE